jgi:ABC-type uncharacterized transport system fused permease/ATPase subunit
MAKAKERIKMRIVIEISFPKKLKKLIKSEFFQDLRKQFWFFFIPIFIFIVFDLISTYIGVCVYKGFELNFEAINLASKYGYLILFPYQVGKYGIAILLLTLFFVKTERFEWKIFIILIWSILLLNYSRTILLNSNNLIYLATGKMVVPSQQIVYYPPEYLQQAKTEFYKVKENFCRLI